MIFGIRYFLVNNTLNMVNNTLNMVNNSYKILILNIIMEDLTCENIYNGK